MLSPKKSKFEQEDEQVDADTTIKKERIEAKAPIKDEEADTEATIESGGIGVDAGSEKILEDGIGGSWPVALERGSVDDQARAGHVGMEFQIEEVADGESTRSSENPLGLPGSPTARAATSFLDTMNDLGRLVLVLDRVSGKLQQL